VPIIRRRPRGIVPFLAVLCSGALSLATSAVAITTLAAPAQGAPGCDRYASPSGNDANGGTTPATALASPITLLSELAAGQVGCLEDGANFVLGNGEAITDTGGAVGSPKTLRPTTPGARATITTATGLWLQSASHDLVFQDLDIRRNGPPGSSLFLVDGDRITLTGLDLTYPANICLDVGPDSRHMRTKPVDPVEDLAVLNSRVHDCGSAYGPPHGTNDSGVHGIYLEFLRDGADADGYSAILRNNVIDHNHNRGLQLYPDVKNALVTHNVLYANGANVNLGSQVADADPPVYSTGNTITDNVLADSVLDGLTEGGFVGDTAEVVGNFPNGYDAHNHVDSNCISNSAHPDRLYELFPIAFTHVDNIENQPPVFVDAAGGDYHQTVASPCLGDGLEQSTVPGRPTVTGSTPTAGAVTVAFTPPASNGGSTITQYTAQCVSTDGGVSAATVGASSPIKVLGLTGGKHYHCRARATNAVGAGPYGGYGVVVLVPAAVAPSAVSVTASVPAAGAVTVSFGPGSDGGSPILQYGLQCVSTDGGVGGSATGSTSPTKVLGLTGGKHYHCRVRATNAVGTGPFGGYGATVLVPVATTPPGTPVTGSVPSARAVSVSFGAPASDGGSPILQYAAQCVSTDGGISGSTTGTGSPIKVLGLTSGKHYHCHVRATNAVGTGPYGGYGATVLVP
jgi:hypothetical protein